MLPKELSARRAGLPVIVLGEADGDVSVGVQAMKAGAIDFLNMPYRLDQLLDALAAAQASIRETAERSQAAELAAATIAALPPREREVLDGLLAGGTNKTIARDLGLSGASGKSCCPRQEGNAGRATWPMPTPLAPDEGMAMCIPVDGRAVDRIGDLVPGLKPPAR
jgi:FixJ family two-component response regulator